MFMSCHQNNAGRNHNTKTASESVEIFGNNTNISNLKDHSPMQYEMSIGNYLLMCQSTSGELLYTQ
jgi:hypothetical protein